MSEPSFEAVLLREASAHVADGRDEVALVGIGPEALAVKAGLQARGVSPSIFDPAAEADAPRIRPWGELAAMRPSLVVITRDAEKESLLRAVADALAGQEPLPAVVLGGLAHQELDDETFAELEAPALVPSYATGHPHTRAHLYDCLRAAATRGREGAIVELGAFKGGTSVWLAKAAMALGLRNCPVIGFDAWDGFPPRRSLLDLYQHPRCVFKDIDAVRRYTEPYGIELVVGDIADTAPARLKSVPVLLAFVDTDNYSGARAAMEVIGENLVPGGAIVLDHFHTTGEYAYTVGERIAASEALSGAGLLHLRGTGVFVNLD